MEGEKTMLQKGRLTEHFSKKEFDCKCGCDTGQISMLLVHTLEQARVAVSYTHLTLPTKAKL